MTQKTHLETILLVCAAVLLCVQSSLWWEKKSIYLIVDDWVWGVLVAALKESEHGNYEN